MHRESVLSNMAQLSDSLQGGRAKSALGHCGTSQHSGGTGCFGKAGSEFLVLSALSQFGVARVNRPELSDRSSNQGHARLLWPRLVCLGRRYYDHHVRLRNNWHPPQPATTGQVRCGLALSTRQAYACSAFSRSVANESDWGNLSFELVRPKSI